MFSQSGKLVLVAQTLDKLNGGIYFCSDESINLRTRIAINRYFYTTIPEDNAAIRNEFGDTFRHLDDFFYGFQGVRCILHNRERTELLAEKYIQTRSKKEL